MTHAAALADRGEASLQSRQLREFSPKEFVQRSF
jgi:hypothetical protein